MPDTLILGVDFTSAPRPRKPITIASGRLRAGRLHVAGVGAVAGFAGFDRLLASPGPWVGGFDFPFGLPRALLERLGWPHQPAEGESGWARMVRHLEAMPRQQMVAAFRGWCDSRPPGAKFAHRATDLLAGSSPSMKWVNPPVAFMLQAGAPRLLAAGVRVPGLHAGDPRRVALEAYPGMLARAVLGRSSYKSDSRAGRTPERSHARARLVAAMEAGTLLGLPVVLPSGLRAACVDDPQGDLLDAVLCALQAAWAQQRRDSNFGLPADIDAVEGWIVGA
ncbi:MAG TPA: DUF429 domain-containing protein [Quisquiliibacterium sp.]|nr:DUF429 domain-containing protein [Quisquiliibacterium sp.]